MRVYRVEHKKSRVGPWHHNNHVANNVMPRYNGLPAMCTYGDDTTIKSVTRSITQLIQWFNDAIRAALDELGFVLRVYEVPELLREDQYQGLAQIKKYQRPVATLSLLDVSNPALP